MKLEQNEIIEGIKNEIDKHSNEVNVASFDMGLSGIALFYYYYYLHSGNKIYYNKFIDCINKSINIIDNINDDTLRYRTDSIDNHLGSMGRLLMFVQSKLEPSLDFKNLLNQFDDLLTPLLYTKLGIKDFNFNSGALASGYYFISRYKINKSLKIKKILLDITDRINSASQMSKNGIYWSSPTINNAIYLGISHGSSMIAVFLSNIIDIGISNNEIKSILRKCILFLINNKRDQKKGIFTICYYPNNLDGETQFSLCYGDLGVGYAMVKAGDSLKDNDIYNEGINILIECSYRKKENNHTPDATITYGAAGIACLFEQAFKLTKKPIFKDSMDYWIEMIPSYIKDDKFENLIQSDDNIEPYLSFDWGLAGIGSTLIRSSNWDEIPSFNELLLISSYYTS